MSGFEARVIRAAYAAVAGDYLERFGNDLADLELDRRLLDTVAERAAHAGPVLDVGCGPGHVGRYVAAHGVDVIGIDLTPAMLTAASGGEPRLPLVAADLRALPVQSASVGGVTAFYVLQHIARSELGNVLGEARRVLTRDGSLALVVHEGKGEFHPAPDITATRYTERELAEHCDRVGLGVESVHRRGPLPHEHQGGKLYVLARGK